MIVDVQVKAKRCIIIALHVLFTLKLRKSAHVFFTLLGVSDCVSI